MMKRVLYILLSIGLLISCQDYYNPVEGYSFTDTARYLRTDVPKIDFDTPLSQELSFSISSINTPWRIDNDALWVNFNPNKGISDADISVKVSENKVGDVPRMAIAYLKSDTQEYNYDKPIIITQASPKPIINVSNNNLVLGAATGSSGTIEIISNCDWTISNNNSWLRCDIVGDTINLTTLSDNLDNKYRSGQIMIVHEGDNYVSKTITIRQSIAGISASSESIEFDNNASKVGVLIKSDTPWTATTSEYWIDIDPSSGNAGDSTLNISVSPNTSISNRIGYVILTIGSTKRIQIPINQQGIYIRSEINSLSFLAGESSQIINIKSNTHWKVVSVPNWLSVNVLEGSGDGSITVSAIDNPNTTQRNGTIHISEDGLSIDLFINVSQEGKYFSLSTNSLLLQDGSETKTVEIQSDGVWNATSSNDWITLSNYSGSGNSSLSISVNENKSDSERNGIVSITVGDKTLIINVVQKGKNLIIPDSSLSFPAEESTLDLEIGGTGYWSIDTMPSWISVDKSTGVGATTIKVKAENNPNTSSRTGEMIISQTYSDNKKTIKITQNGKYFEISTSSIEFDDKEETKQVEISSDGYWEASSTEEWISLSPTSKYGQSILNITVSENKSSSERTGQVKVSLGDKTLIISVNQKAKFFNIQSDDLSFTSKGGTISITISTNDVWSAEIEKGNAWLSLSNTSGSGSASLNVMATDNPSLNSRNGSILFKSNSGHNFRIEVKQMPRYLTIDTQSILFYAKGGTSNAITISTDAQYSIYSEAEWISIIQDQNTFKVRATANESYKPRQTTIIIAMTDLIEEEYKIELQLIQLNNGGTFIIDGFKEDNNWDNSNRSNEFELNLLPFGNDKNWDSYSYSQSLSILVSGYITDKCWDEKFSSNLKVIINGYSDDKCYDNQIDSDGDIICNGFDNDINWE